ncbi:MAG: glyoxylate/hydroxypyruvate reductase A [Desulfosarcinaceae bacterium]|jgi:glyoxylate/hydroxypyruvate reductase A
MPLLLAAPTLKPDAWLRAFKKRAPELEVRVWPEGGDPADIGFIAAWETPPGFFAQFPNLKCIASLGAGVDHLLADPELPEGVFITRVIDPSIARQMSEYLLLHVLRFSRHSRQFDQNAAREVWRPRIPMRAADLTVGIMGMGQLGLDAARKLMPLDFPVIGWRRTAQAVEGVQIFSGPDELPAFLAASRILVCTLPLTRETRGILDAAVFKKLPEGAYVINVARGAHLKEVDLLDALDRRHLSGACLDVFQTEPLPAGHPFWHHPKVTVTPHVASLTNPYEVVPQMAANYRRVMAGERPHQLVDLARGY